MTMHSRTRLVRGVAFCLLLLTAAVPARALSGGLGSPGKYVPGEVLIHVGSPADADLVAKRYALTITGRLDGLGWYRAALPRGQSVPNAVVWLGRDARVQSICPNHVGETPETDQIIHAFIDGSPTTGEYRDQSAFERIKGQEAWQYRTGAATLVAVIDTGVDLDHPDLAGRISSDGYDFVGRDTVPDDELNGIDDDRDGEVDEGAGHGTHIAGIIALVHPEAVILPVRVLDSDGVGSAFDVAMGIVYAVQHGAPVINLSLGVATSSPALAAAVAYAVDSGANVIASAGNRNTDRPQYPAAYPGVIAVAATDSERLKAPFSNYGDLVAVAAPGVEIYSTFVGGGYAWWSGTSFSTAFVSGQSALLMAVDVTLPPQSTNEFISSTAENEDPRYALGAGEIQLLASAEEASGSD